jgi:hypothetical protein
MDGQARAIREGENTSRRCGALTRLFGGGVGSVGLPVGAGLRSRIPRAALAGVCWAGLVDLVCRLAVGCAGRILGMGAGLTQHCAGGCGSRLGGVGSVGLPASSDRAGCVLVWGWVVWTRWGPCSAGRGFVSVGCRTLGLGPEAKGGRQRRAGCPGWWPSGCCYAAAGGLVLCSELYRGCCNGST